MKTKHNFRERRKALVFLGIDEKGGDTIHFFGDPRRYPAPRTVRTGEAQTCPMPRTKEPSGFFLRITVFKAADSRRRRLMVQVDPCQQRLEPLVFAKIIVPGIYFDVRERRGVLPISLLQKQHGFPLLG